MEFLGCDLGEAGNPKKNEAQGAPNEVSLSPTPDQTHAKEETREGRTTRNLLSVRLATGLRGVVEKIL